MEMKSTKINLTEEERNTVDVRLKALKETCQIYGLPMFASVVIKNDENITEYLRIINTAQSHAIFLANDEIRKHMLVSNGFEVVPPRNILTVNGSDDFFRIGDDVNEQS